MNFLFIRHCAINLDHVAWIDFDWGKQQDGSNSVMVNLGYEIDGEPSTLTFHGADANALRKYFAENCMTHVVSVKAKAPFKPLEWDNGQFMRDYHARMARENDAKEEQ